MDKGNIGIEIQNENEIRIYSNGILETSLLKRLIKYLEGKNVSLKEYKGDRTYHDVHIYIYGKKDGENKIEFPQLD